MKKSKVYLELNTFFEDGVKKFGWKKVSPNRKRNPSKILGESVLIKSYDAKTNEESYMKDSDIEKYIILSLGLTSKELYKTWFTSKDKFEELYKTLTLSYTKGDGEFFLNLCNLYLNDISFDYGDKNFTKVSYT